VTGRGLRSTHAPDREHGREPVDVDLANPSGHVDVLLGDRVAAVVTFFGALLPDPWRSVEGRGDGSDVS